MKPAAFIPLAAIVLTVAGCSKNENAGNEPPPVANDPLQAAFAVAFPSGATEKDANGNTMTFTPAKLVPVVSDGSVQALISEGSLGDDAAHVQTGALRITYLNSTGDTFSRPDPRVQENLDGDGFGKPPQWKMIELHHKPAIRIEYTYSNQGCTDTTIDVYVLDTNGINQNEHASKPMKEECEDQSDAGSASGADASVEENSTGSSGDGDGNTTTSTAPPQ